MQNESRRKGRGSSLLWLALLAVLLLQASLIGLNAQNRGRNAASAYAAGANMNVNMGIAESTAPVEFTLRTHIGGEPAMAFVGVGGDIDGVVNPDLVAPQGATVRITVINGDPTLHDFNIDEFNAHTGQLVTAEQTATVEFVADKSGMFEYYCNIPGHRQVGMKGTLHVEGDGSDMAQGAGAGNTGDAPAAAASAAAALAVPVAAPAAADAVSIVRNPADLPPSVGARGPETVTVDLETVELNGILADGTTFHYMTFGGQVPGPMLRVREDDTVVITLHNRAGNMMTHSIDLHAVTGPGGGAVYTQVLPGESGSFTFKALSPGVYVYHCATASVPHHIMSGMYGLIVVEPAGGLPPVDHEFYVMQGEIYTAQPFGTKGQLDFSYEAMLDEAPEYYVFNGSAGALTQDANALRANVGDTVRIFFGVGGPNAMSSFHVIGEMFDRVYNLASLTTPPMTDVQTTVVPPGGATMVEFKVEVPGRYILVDHALSRMERGLAGYLYVEGAEDPSIFHGEGAASMAGH